MLKPLMRRSSGCEWPYRGLGAAEVLDEAVQCGRYRSYDTVR